MKLDSYHLVSFQDICVGMKEGNDSIRWLKIPQKAKSLHSLIADGKYRQTYLGRNAWKGLLKSPSLQLNCNIEGFNPQSPGCKTRIGIISNQETHCNDPDSRIGFGGWGCGKNSVGNGAFWNADNGDRDVATFGYILVK